MIKTTLDTELAKVKTSYNLGKIQTKQFYLENINKTIKTVVNSYNKPKMIVFEARTIPSKKDFSLMIGTAINDLNSVLTNCSGGATSFNGKKRVIVDNLNILYDKVIGASVQIKIFEQKMNEIKTGDSVSFTNSFERTTNLADKEIKDVEQIAVCDLMTKRLTLPVIKTSNVANDFDIEILNTSNGFPGNTHEVYNSNTVRYIGEDDPRTDLGLIKAFEAPYNSSLSNLDYFEFEMYNISEEVKLKTGNIGFRYKENILWINDDKELRLNLKIALKEPTRSNYISIAAPPTKNSLVRPPKIKNITIIDSFAQAETITLNKSFEETTVLNFKDRIVDSILIELNQSEKYETNVCRQYGLSVDPRNVSLYLDKLSYVKIEQPVHSINLLNLKHDNKTQKIIYPSTKDKSDFIDKEYAKSKLFYIPMENEKLIETEIVKAQRYNIGVSSITLNSREYGKKGIFISEIYNTEGFIKSIIFSADDYIPHYFEDKIDSIKYFVSFENNEWTRIYPKEKPSNGPSSIEINSETMIVNRNKNIIYIDSLIRHSSFQIKIELTGDSGEKFLTPTVLKYHLEVEIEDI